MLRCVDLKRMLILALLACYGCASIVSGRHQKVAVHTKRNGQALTHANCRLSNDHGAWSVTTPGEVAVHRSFKDLSVSCERLGMTPATRAVKSTTNPYLFGNIPLLGTVLWSAIDASTGAAFDYPWEISIAMDAGPEPEAILRLKLERTLTLRAAVLLVSKDAQRARPVAYYLTTR